MKFIKLTYEHEPRWFRCDAIIAISQSSTHGSDIELASEASFGVDQCPAEILALLAEPQPVAVTVTDAMVEAALIEWLGDAAPKAKRALDPGLLYDMRAALEAALAVRAP